MFEVRLGASRMIKYVIPMLATLTAMSGMGAVLLLIAVVFPDVPRQFQVPLVLSAFFVAAGATTVMAILIDLLGDMR